GSKGGGLRLAADTPPYPPVSGGPQAPRSGLAGASGRRIAQLWDPPRSAAGRGSPRADHVATPRQVCRGPCVPSRGYAIVGVPPRQGTLGPLHTEPGGARSARPVRTAGPG